MPKPQTSDHIGTKLAIAIKEKGVSQKKVADEFGVKPPTVSQDWIKYGRIHKRHIPHLVEYFGHPYEWWLTNTTQRSKPRTSDIVSVRWYSETRLAAGSGISVEEDGPVKDLAFRTDWLRGRGLNPDRLVAVHAEGNSMQPRIQDGDLLLVNTAQKEIQNRKVYAFLQKRAGRVKRLATSNTGLRIISDNAAEFPEQVIADEQLRDITIIGRVVWVAGDVR